MLDRKPRSLHVDAERVVERGLVERGDWTELGDPAARSLGLSLAAISRQMGDARRGAGRKAPRPHDTQSPAHRSGKALPRARRSPRARRRRCPCSEGVDLAVRAGLTLPDSSSLVAAPLATFRRVLCASPAYLRRHGTPQSVGALASHLAVAGSRAASTWSFVEDGETRATMPLARTGSSMTSHSRDALVDRARSADSLTSASRSAASAFIAERASPKCSSIASK